MAQQQIIRLVDDIDGTEIPQGKGETISFSLDGASYEIDLNEKNAKAMRAALGEYIDYARKAGRATASARGRKAGTTRDYDPAAVRAWAKANGHKAPDRGRFPNDLIEAYKAAGN